MRRLVSTCTANVHKHRLSHTHHLVHTGTVALRDGAVYSATPVSLYVARPCASVVQKCTHLAQLQGTLSLKAKRGNDANMFRCFPYVGIARIDLSTLVAHMSGYRPSEFALISAVIRPER